MVAIAFNIFVILLLIAGVAFSAGLLMDYLVEVEDAYEPVVAMSPADEPHAPRATPSIEPMDKAS